MNWLLVFPALITLTVIVVLLIVKWEAFIERSRAWIAAHL